MEGPTWHSAARTIVEAKCASCHQPGDIGPFSLTTYDEVLAFETAVRMSIEDGSMPPWQPSEACTEYIGNIDLTAEERQTLLEWLDAGAPEGDPSEAPSDAAAREDAPWQADLTLPLPEPYTPQGEPDDYRCQLIPWPETEPAYVRGLRVIPDQRAIVHHTIAFVVGPDQVAQYQAWDEAEEGPGYTCYGGPTASYGTEGGALGDLDPAALLAALEAVGLSLADLQSGNVTDEQMTALFLELGADQQVGSFGTLGSWVPGAADLLLPEGTGIRVEPGSMIVAQMHYNTVSSDPVPDQSVIEIAVAPTVERPATNLVGLDLGWVTDGLLGEPMDIPAGEEEVTHATTIEYDSLFVQGALQTLGLEPGDRLVLHRANHHMHELGAEQISEIEHADGTTSCLLHNADWDFHWQGSYQLAEPVVMGPGDRLDMACTWDNSAANQPSVDGEILEPIDVAWGEGTRDEMCLGSFYVTAE